MNTKKNTRSRRKKAASATTATPSFSLLGVWHGLKKFFLPWLILSVLAASLAVGSNYLFSPETDVISATINLNYDGIESGLDPNGCEFNTESIINDRVVTEALTDMGLSEDLRESVQNSILINGVVPSSAVSDLTSYSSIYSSSSSDWIEAIHDTSYRPTKYEISFTYSNTGLSGKQAATLLNGILENYQTYFLETYGYNDSISDTIADVDPESSDYLIALEMYASMLDSMENYVDRIGDSDSSQFRSDVTGYTFSDLSDALHLIRSVDIDTLTSYVLNNGVIHDQDMIVSYYNYRINYLNRFRQSQEEQLASVNDSIDTYQKDAILFYNTDGTVSSSSTQTSSMYDSLIAQRISIQAQISSYDQQISNYKKRLASIEKTSKSTSDDKQTYVETHIAALQEKIEKLTDSIRDTANDYYENVKFTNAVTIISPATHSGLQTFKSTVKASMRVIIISELILLTLYLFISIVSCFPFHKFRTQKTCA